MLTAIGACCSLAMRRTSIPLWEVRGLNIGVQDAVNLGWKLAQVVKGTSPESLLDSYQAERHPVAARVLLNTMADVVLQRQDERTQALVTIVSELATMEGPANISWANGPG